MIRELIVTALTLGGLSTSNTSNHGSVPPLFPILQQIRTCLSILFHFLRRQLPHKETVSDIRNWVNKLGAIYVRLSNWHDHLFIIFHVLRCPPGISSWAKSIIQIPAPTDSTSVAEIDHCITFIKILMTPTRQRNEFLSQLVQSNKPIDAAEMSEDSWIVIDSEGEEDSPPDGECTGLKESDLIALLNQVPFEKIFR